MRAELACVCVCASSEHTGCCTRLYDLISYQKFPLPRHAPDNINVYEGETGTSRNENFNNLRSVETRSFGSRRRHAQNINNALISESLGSFTPSKIIPVTTTTLHIRFVVSSDITSSPRRCTGRLHAPERCATCSWRRSHAFTALVLAEIQPGIERGKGR